MLFLDEVNEFRRDAVEGLRQPLEDGRVVVARALGAAESPARFALITVGRPGGSCGPPHIPEALPRI